MRRDMDPRPPRNGLSLAAGAGGLDMGLMLAEPGFETRCWVEWDGEPRERIIAAQRAGYLAPAPIWDDVRTYVERLLVKARRRQEFVDSLMRQDKRLRAEIRRLKALVGKGPGRRFT